MSSNQEIVKILRAMSALYEMEGVLFKPRAYEKAVLGVWLPIGLDLKPFLFSALFFY